MKNKKIQMIAEGGLCLGLALALSYWKIPVVALGGSIDFVMIPLIVFAFRWGAGWGVGLGLAFGTLKFFLAGGSAVNWQSMLLDYSVAYAFVGFAGLVKPWKWGLPVGALIGCAARFVVHFFSGITIYASYFTNVTRFLWWDVSTPNVPLYSAVANASYMLPNTVIAVFLCALLMVPLQLLDKRR